MDLPIHKLSLPHTEDPTEKKQVVKMSQKKLKEKKKKFRPKRKFNVNTNKK